MAVADASTIGSLAPHGAEGLPEIQQRQQQWIADPRTACQALDLNFKPGDAIEWPSYCPGGLVTGDGTLSFLRDGKVIETIAGTFDGGRLRPGHVAVSWADGSRYDGNQSNGLFDGEGAFLSAVGNKLAGKWTAGELDVPPPIEAAQTVTHGSAPSGVALAEAPGSSAAGAQTGNVDRLEGGPQPSHVQPSTGAETEPPVPAAVPVAPQQPPRIGSTVPESQGGLMPLRPLLGKTLIAVDGSTFDLTETEGGLTRKTTSPNGSSMEINFALMNDRIGTVSSDSTAIGLFRATNIDVEIDYTDGHVETLKPDSDGGLITATRASDGTFSCKAWYPTGHVFSKEEREAAVLEYANRLGVAAPPLQKKRGAAHQTSPACDAAHMGVSALSTAIPARDLASRLDNPTAPPTRETAARNYGDDSRGQTSSADMSRDLRSVSVRTSLVHAIEPGDDSTAPRENVVDASFAIRADAVPRDASMSALTLGRASPAVSDCLQVASNGDYWGFQNRCAKPLQFSYCELNDSNPLTSCERTSVSGSVAANGFSALVGDHSLAERDVKHDFRWLACDGGAGEVVAHLDRFNPPEGRCLRANSTVN
jgi:hypothetical protein